MIRDRWFIISNRNQKKFYWDLLVIFLAIYNAIALPMRIAFVQVEQLYEDEFVLFLLETTIDVLFGVDILLAFFTEYIDMAFGEKIRQPKKIAKRYMKGGFWVDFVSTLPLVLKPLIGSTLEKGSEF